MTPVTRDPEHSRRVVDALRSAIATVPFYAKAGYSAPPEGASLEEALGALPLLTRDKVRPTLPKQWVPEGRDLKSELASGTISVIEMGTGDSRMRVLFDATWWREQERRALTVNPRAAAALAGELGPYKDAVLWVPERGTGSCGSGDPEYEDRLEGARVHLNSRQDPTFWTEPVMTRMLEELGLHETVGLLADPFYLDVLARHAAVLGRKLDVRGFVALTRALTTSAHRAMLRRVYPGTVIDVLSAREAGTLFVESDDRKLHHAPLGTHVELLPAKVATPGAERVAMIVVTTIDRPVQPLVRFVLGDLVQVAEGEGRFTDVSPIASVEGKLDDAILRPDGAIVTPRAIDRALSELEMRAYEVTQREPNVVEIEVVGGPPDAARDALAPLLEGMTITASTKTALAVEPNGKYKTSRRVAGLQPVAGAF
jgi:phenylacetate-coenzyme A ligase PaaK-like adenylate-forming protein